MKEFTLGYAKYLLYNGGLYKFHYSWIHSIQRAVIYEAAEDSSGNVDVLGLSENGEKIKAKLNKICIDEEVEELETDIKVLAAMLTGELKPQVVDGIEFLISRHFSIIRCNGIEHYAYRPMSELSKSSVRIITDFNFAIFRDGAAILHELKGGEIEEMISSCEKILEVIAPSAAVLI